MALSRALFLSIALACVQTALAQARSIPADAQRGYLKHERGSQVFLDGAAARLAPGATIRDQRNLIIVPAAMPPEGAWADYVRDANGQIFRVWLLSPEEQARPGAAAPR
jgi:hypothetical protein